MKSSPMKIPVWLVQFNENGEGRKEEQEEGSGAACSARTRDFQSSPSPSPITVSRLPRPHCSLPIRAPAWLMVSSQAQVCGATLP